MNKIKKEFTNKNSNENNEFLLESIHDTGTTILEIGEDNSELKHGKFDGSILKGKPLFPIKNKKYKINVKVTNIYRDTIANTAALGRNISKDLIEKIMCS